MRRDNIFWGSVLILVGVLLFLQTQGIIGNIFQYFWPLALILVGGWIILGVYWKPDISSMESFSIPLGAAQSVKYHFAHGAGQLEITGSAPAGQALVGTSGTATNRTSQLNGDRLDVRIEARPTFVPFLGPGQSLWRFQLAQNVPVLLTIESGASSLDINLADVLATRVALKTGASSSNVTMPAHGASVLDVEAGAASVNIRVPESSAARIRAKNSVIALNVDTNRFPRLDSGIYQSSDFDTATNRTEINIEAGLGSVSVK
jgi:cell wall-active antibiotic response 4TMS protein YvqF